MFWKSLWGTTFVVTFLPDLAVKASVTAWYARLGTSSEDPEPKVRPGESEPVADGALPPVQAASSGMPAIATAPAPNVFNSVLRSHPPWLEARSSASSCMVIISPLK